MPTERFVASRWTRGNLLFPTVIAVTDTALVRTKRSWFSTSEMAIHLQRVASVHVETGLLWSEVLVESTGGTDPIRSHGHRKADARRIKELVEAAQERRLSRGGDGEPVPEATKVCPFCAETIKQAAKVCRFCGRELPGTPA
jgi:hypothetical protein